MIRDKGEINLYAKANYSLSEKISVFGDLQYRHILYKMTGIDDDLRDIGQEHRFGFFNPKGRHLFFHYSKPGCIPLFFCGQPGTYKD